VGRGGSLVDSSPFV